ncbi:MAG: hypothetical protein V1658_01885 [Candidatus Micrarchaeota archaeon]
MGISMQPHIGIVSWHPDSLSQSAPAMLAAFPESQLLVCCSKPNLPETRALFGEKGRQLVFFPQALDRVLDYYGEHTRAESIGHCRNLIQLASVALSQDANLIYLDDDVIPGKETAEGFRRAFGEYDLVPGTYTGCSGNRIYPLVFFFQLLETGRGTWDFEKKAGMALRGGCPNPN